MKDFFIPRDREASGLVYQNLVEFNGEYYDKKSGKVVDRVPERKERIVARLRYDRKLNTNKIYTAQKEKLVILPNGFSFVVLEGIDSVRENLYEMKVFSDKVSFKTKYGNYNWGFLYYSYFHLKYKDVTAKSYEKEQYQKLLEMIQENNIPEEKIVEFSLKLQEYVDKQLQETLLRKEIVSIQQDLEKYFLDQLEKKALTFDYRKVECHFSSSYIFSYGFSEYTGSSNSKEKLHCYFNDSFEYPVLEIHDQRVFDWELDDEMFFECFRINTKKRFSKNISTLDLEKMDIGLYLKDMSDDVTVNSKESIDKFFQEHYVWKQDVENGYEHILAIPKNSQPKEITRKKPGEWEDKEMK